MVRALRRMRKSLVLKQVVPNLLWYGLLVGTAILLDYVLHRLDLAWVGRYVGLIGTALILLSFIYSLRKRKVIDAGSPKTLLDVHEMLSWAGALMILVHAGIHFNALLPWLALSLMLIVVASGFTGKILLKEARERVKARQDELRAQGLDREAVQQKVFPDSLTVEVMKKWRAVHLPLTTLLATLALLHIVSILSFWRW